MPFCMEMRQSKQAKSVPPWPIWPLLSATRSRAQCVPTLFCRQRLLPSLWVRWPQRLLCSRWRCCQYGLVAGIVKLDDLGLWLTRQGSSLAQGLGRGIVGAAPWLMKGLSIAGTAAMFLVGGGILAHGVPWLHHTIEAAGAAALQWPAGVVWHILVPNLLNALLGVVAGAMVLALVLGVQRVRGTAAH